MEAELSDTHDPESSSSSPDAGPGLAFLGDDPVGQHHGPGHDGDVDSGRRLRTLAERFVVDHGRRVEQHDVGDRTDGQHPAIGEAEPPRRLGGHLAHCIGQLEVQLAP